MKWPIVTLTLATLGLVMAACGDEGGVAHGIEVTTAGLDPTATIPPATVTIGSGSFEVVASQSAFGFDLVETRRSFADGYELHGFMQGNMGYDSSIVVDGNVGGGAVVDTFFGYPLYHRIEMAPEPQDWIVQGYHVRDPSLATLGGWTGEIEVNGQVYCIDEDGDCTGAPSYLVPIDPDPDWIKASVVTRTGSTYKMRAESYRTRWWFFVAFATTGAKTESKDDTSPNRYSWYWVTDYGMSQTVYDPYSVRNSSNYDCFVSWVQDCSEPYLWFINQCGLHHFYVRTHYVCRRKALPDMESRVAGEVEFPGFSRSLGSSRMSTTDSFVRAERRFSGASWLTTDFAEWNTRGVCANHSSSRVGDSSFGATTEWGTGCRP